MDNLWVILMIFAQLAWAVGIYIDKYLINSAEDEEAEEESIGMMLIFGGVFNIVVAGFSYIVLSAQHGFSDALSFIAFDLRDIFAAIGVGVMEIVWVIPYMYALHFADESTAPPVFQTVPIFGFFLGYFFFGEIPTTLHILAGICIIIGALILNVELLKEDIGDKRVVFDRRPFALMLLSSFIIALIAFVFKDTAESQNYWGTTFWMGIGGTLAGIWLWAFITPYRIQFNRLFSTRNWKLIGINTLNETVDQIAILAFYGAVILGPSTALIQSTDAYQPVFLLLIGYILAKFGSKRHVDLLRTSEITKRAAGISIILLGSLLIFV